MQGMKNISTRDLCSLRTQKTQYLHLLQDNIGLAKQNKNFNTKLKDIYTIGCLAQLPLDMCDLLGAGLEPASPALAGGFLVTGSPWKPSTWGPDRNRRATVGALFPEEELGACLLRVLRGRCYNQLCRLLH